MSSDPDSHRSHTALDVEIAPTKPLAIVNPNALTREEADRLREAGYDVPAPQPKPSIWK